MVEDDDDYAVIVRLCLEEPEGLGLAFDLDRVRTLSEGLSMLGAGRYDAALVDLGLPDARGLEAVKTLAAAAPDLPLLVSTNLGAEGVALDSMRLGAQDFLVKGSSDSRLLKRSIRYAIERKSFEVQQKELLERRQRDELKDQWIGTLSHDLRSPLTVISASVAELAQGRAGPLNEAQTVLAGLARRHTDRLVAMVVHLLELLRLESGVVKADLHSIDPADSVRRVRADFIHAASERALALDLDLPASPLKWDVDPNMFEQLVVNLVDNSLRFARKRVLVRLAASHGELSLAVEDDGVGIPPDKHGALFTRFSQLGRSNQKGYKGTGLGLAICKEIVGLHGGTIGVEKSSLGGTAFVVKLPEITPAVAQPPGAS